MDPQVEGTIAILEQELDKLQSDYNDLFFARESDEIERDHELALYMEYHRRAIAEAASYYDVLIDYIDHFYKHPLNYNSEELRSINAKALRVMGR